MTDIQETEKADLDYFIITGTKPMSVNDLESLLDMDDAEYFKVIVKTLNKLEEEGQLVRTRKNLYGLPEKMYLIRGKVEMHKKGFAFLIPDDLSEKDVYIHSS